MVTKLLRTLVLASTLTVVPGSVLAALAPVDNESLYYQIGGATSVTASPTSTFSRVLSGSAELGLGYSCGKFDPIAGLKNSVEKVADITDTLAAGVSAAIGALPLLIIQRVNPGLYDLLQNLIIKGEATLALANTSCEQMEAEIKRGNNPYEAWTDLSKMMDWKLEMQAGKEDVVGAKTKVEQQNGENGLPWVGGTRAGGKNQKAIHITRDIVSAGYSMNDGKRLKEVFSVWWAASDWAVQVVGDVIISTYDNHVDQSTPGHGLLPQIDKASTKITKDLNALVSGSVTPTLANLAKVSGNDLALTLPVIRAIQDLNPTERAIVTGKLASEVAMSQTLEKAIFVRRMLRSGRFEPNILKTAALGHVDNMLQELDRAIDDVLFEKRVHQELVASTASALLENARQHQNRGKVVQPAAASDLRPMENGAVK